MERRDARAEDRLACHPPKKAAPAAPATSPPFGSSARTRAARLHAGLTQEQLALRADLDMGNVSRYEGGQQEPGLTVIVRIARGLGVSAARLLEGVDAG